MGKYMSSSLNLALKGTLLPALKGNNSRTTHYFRIKVRYVQMVYYIVD